MKHKQLPEGYTIKRTHLHQGNSSKNKRHGHPYVTISRILNRRGDVVSVGKAVCSHNDNPRRDLGRTIADGRALKRLAV